MPAKILKSRLFARLTSNKLVLPYPFFRGKKGFTLIELLVVIVIIGILATILLASYNDFGARQEVRDAAEDLKSNLRKYQTFAISGQKNPTNLLDGSGCNDDDKTLDNYTVEIDESATPPNYWPTINCHLNSDPTVTTNVVMQPVNFPEGITITVNPPCPNIQIIFNPLNQGVQFSCGGNAVQVDVLRGSVTYQVHVSDVGKINVEKP